MPGSNLVQDAPFEPTPPRQRVTDLPEDERPREKLARLGAQALTDGELLAVFFRTGLQGMNAVELGSQLCERYGGLAELARIGVDELVASNKGIGPAKAAELVAVFEMGRRLANERVIDAPLNEPEAIYAYLGTEMRQLKRESLRVLVLNTRFRLIKMEQISIGSANETVAHPRDILKPVILHEAHALVLVHNHPSGDCSPSHADIRLTRRVKEAAEAMQVQLLDHIVIGYPSDTHPKGYCSFAETGVF